MTEWRDAAAREREASRAVVEAGLGLARDAGEKVSPKALESAGDTLQAAAGVRSCATASCTEGSGASGVRAHTRASRGCPCPPRGSRFVEAPPGGPGSTRGRAPATGARRRRRQGAAPARERRTDHRDTARGEGAAVPGQARKRGPQTAIEGSGRGKARVEPEGLSTLGRHLLRERSVLISVLVR